MSDVFLDFLDVGIGVLGLLNFIFEGTPKDTKKPTNSQYFCI